MMSTCARLTATCQQQRCGAAAPVWVGIRGWRGQGQGAGKGLCSALCLCRGSCCCLCSLPPLIRVVPVPATSPSALGPRLRSLPAPTQVAFIDEIFKANSAILNALLTLLNERLFDNGSKRLKAPLLTLVGVHHLLGRGGTGCCLAAWQWGPAAWQWGPAAWQWLRGNGGPQPCKDPPPC